MLGAVYKGFINIFFFIMEMFRRCLSVAFSLIQRTRFSYLSSPKDILSLRLQPSGISCFSAYVYVNAIDISLHLLFSKKVALF